MNDGRVDMMKHTLTAEESRLVKTMRALGNPTRFHILRVLAQRRTCICGEIVDCVPLAQSTVSQHLKVLKDVGLIQGTIQGPATCYCLDAEGLSWLHEHCGQYFGELLEGCCDTRRAAVSPQSTTVIRRKAEVRQEPGLIAES
jgi:ArsR family transcriptional regulator